MSVSSQGLLSCVPTFLVDHSYVSLFFDIFVMTYDFERVTSQDVSKRDFNTITELPLNPKTLLFLVLQNYNRYLFL